MSRNQPTSATSKYKISSPQPYVSADANRFAIPSPAPSHSGPYPSFPSQPPYPASTSTNRSPNVNGNGTSSPASTGTPSGSPMRPARSRMRDAPPPPNHNPNPNPSTSQANPALSRRELRPVQTQGLRRPSNPSISTNPSNLSVIPPTTKHIDHEMPISPISPVSPIPPLQQNNGLFTDPFAADKAARHELRAQTNVAAQQASQLGNGGDKLRNAVGAFMNASKSRDRDEGPARRPAKSRARAQVQEEIWEVTEGSSGKFGEIDSVLKKIKKDWPFVLESDFSPSTLALSLLSSLSTSAQSDVEIKSSLPQHPGLSSFMKLHEALSSALQTAVQAHFQSFAASLPAHASFLGTLGRAQEQVRGSKLGLKEARDGFAGKGKGELAGIRVRERMVRDMLKILDVIDELKQVPDQLETLIGDKKFLQAALILVKSIKTINKPEIAEIGAMSDLRAYFISQESTLADILVDELHTHLYLKTYYSDSRWQAYMPGQQGLPVMEARIDDITAVSSSIDGPPSSPAIANGELPSNTAQGSKPSSRFSRYLNNLSTKPSQDPMLDYSNAEIGTIAESNITHRRSIGQGTLGGSGELGNVEMDSYGYIEVVLEALAVLGRLGSALEVVAQRVAGEIHALVEITLDEVEERSEQRREAEESALSGNVQFDGDSNKNRDSMDVVARRKSLFAPAETRMIALALDAVGPARHAAVLRDLFWTLYSKLAAVLEGHRVVYEVSRWISARRDFKDSTLGKGKSTLDIPVLEVWKPIQQEVRTLLHNYLTDDSRGSDLDRHPLMSINEILRDGKVARERQKQMFKFADTDSRAVTNDTKAIDESIQLALKASVPGLVVLQTAENTISASTAGSLSTEERYTTTEKHRTLIPPNAFNVSTLFQPTLAFIERASVTAPAGFEEEPRAFSGVLEDFVVKVFLPQLDEKVTASFQQAVSGYDAYQIDRKMIGEVTHPPLKSSVRVMALIHSLCTMLQTTPFHRENYSRLIVGVIVQYYQQCSSRFKELASLPPSGESQEILLSLPATWAQREDVIKLMTELRSVAPADRHELQLLGQKEVRLEMDLIGDQGIVESKLIHSRRKLEALGTLCQSLRWFIESLLDLQDIAEEPFSPSDPDGPQISEPYRSPLSTIEAGDAPRLPLTRAMAQRYKAIVQTYEQLTEMVLNTIRLEIRCRIICNLGASLRKGDFRLESEALEPDPDVVDLDTSLNESDEIITRTLDSDDRSFVLRNIGQLVDHTFIHAARTIKMVNTPGVKKIKRNIMSMQQTLRGMSQGTEDGVLSRSVGYWDLYEAGPKEMLETIRSSKPVFSFDDYNTMLNLQCKAEQSDAPSSELNTYLIDLHALSMSIDGWEIGDAEKR